MKSAITVAAIAIAAIVNRSGWVASCNVDALDPGMSFDALDPGMSFAALTAMGCIVAADSGPCDLQREQKAYSDPIVPPDVTTWSADPDCATIRIFWPKRKGRNLTQENCMQTF